MADDRDMIAAEFVLGTLPEAERAAAAARLLADPAFAAAVRAWEDRLAPLDDETAPVSPPARLWTRIDGEIALEAATPRADPAARLADAAGPSDEGDVVDLLRRRLGRWRATALAAAALAAGLAAVAVLDRHPALFGPALPGGRYVAVVNRDASLPALIVDVDTAAGRVTVRPVAAEQPAGRSLELWVIPAGGKPRSLGVIDPAAPVVDVAAAKAAGVAPDSTLAVSVEPPGGSPSGDPTGPVIYSGRLVPTGN